MDTIDCMRSFSAVARQRSFTDGAKQLDISTKLASKYVRQLEQRLGAQLFHRTTRSVTLTETGQAYFARCVQVLDQFDELEGLVQLRQSELAGPIRITAPTGFGSTHLVDAISPFQRAHPNVRIQLQLSDHYLSLVEEGFDLAVRFGELGDSNFIARKLMNVRLVVFASPRYLAEHGEPDHPSALSTHNCLLMKTSVDPEHWTFRIGGDKQAYRVDGTFQANNPRAVAQMAASGLGIGMCPLYAIEPYLASGELQLLFEDKEATQLPLNAVYPLNRHLTARVRALIDHLAMTFEGNSPK